MPITKTCPTCGQKFTHPPSKSQTYCSKSCRRHPPEVRAKIGLSGPDNPNFKGGWSGQGRVRLWLPIDERPRHPTCSSKGYILRYHKVWNDAHPDDPVLPGEVIHHINGDSADDRIENLEKMESQSPHAAEHFRRPRGPLSDAHRAALSAAHRKDIPDKPCENCGTLLKHERAVAGCRFCSPACHYAFRTGKPRKGW